MKLIYKIMRLHRTSSLGFFCTLLIIITVKRMFVQTGFVQQPSFRYEFLAICCGAWPFLVCGAICLVNSDLVNLDSVDILF